MVEITLVREDGGGDSGDSDGDDIGDDGGGGVGGGGNGGCFFVVDAAGIEVYCRFVCASRFHVRVAALIVRERKTLPSSRPVRR